MLICMAIASAAFIVFALMILTASRRMMAALLVVNMELLEEEAKQNLAQMNILREQLRRTRNAPDKKAVKQYKKLDKRNHQIAKSYQELKKGKINLIDMIPLAGYRMLKLLGWEDSTNQVVRNLNAKCMQFKEKQPAAHYTIYLLASLFSYTLLGLCVAAAVMAITLAMDMGLQGVIASVIVFALFFIMGYVPYDNVNDTVKKRSEEISRQFPNAMSKMTLLILAGMEVNQAWRETCTSRTGVLYEEMQRVVMDLDNNVPSAEAYNSFIRRCNNPYTTRLGTAILQNYTKGNSRIGDLFRQINAESWNEHKHDARRQGEAISSKLFLPTMLMFAGILILIVVPVMSAFNF